MKNKKLGDKKFKEINYNRSYLKFTCYDNKEFKKKNYKYKGMIITNRVNNSTLD